MLKTFLFDLGNVLVFFCHDRMCRQIGELFGRPAEEVRQQLMASGLQWDYERGRIDEPVLQSRLEELFGSRVSLPALKLAIADIFVLNQSMLPVLDELKRQGGRLVLLSNTCRSHIEFIRSQWDVLDRFDQLVLSYEVGAVKPEEAIYHAALQAIECAPGETLYTDDIEPYVEQGRAVGLQAVQFTGTAQYLRDLRRFGVELSEDLAVC